MAFPRFSGMQWWHRNTVNTGWAETLQREWTDCWTDQRAQAVSIFPPQRCDLFCRSWERFGCEPSLLPSSDFKSEHRFFLWERKGSKF